MGHPFNLGKLGAHRTEPCASRGGSCGNKKQTALRKKTFNIKSLCRAHETVPNQSSVNRQVERVKPNIIRLRQDRYLLNPELRNTSLPSPYAYKWEIPITYISCNDHKTVSQVP